MGFALLAFGIAVEIFNIAFDRGLLAWFVGACAAAVIMVGAGIAVVSAVVLERQRRLQQLRPDLYLDLNESRTAKELARPDGFRAGFVRRALARMTLGHDYLVGDPVEIRSLKEIEATLDADGCLDGMPFMAEMRRFCGRNARVFRSVDKIYDYDRTKDMRDLKNCVVLTNVRCDGAMHGQCEAACFALWNVNWLRHTADFVGRTHPVTAPASEPSLETYPGQRFSCQYTQLHSATRPLHPMNPLQDLRPLVAGNITWLSFLVAVGTRAFNFMQQVRRGVIFPVLEQRKDPSAIIEECALAVGDLVTVRSAPEIAQTLNRHNKHKGLWFDRDMLKFCGQTYRVSASVTRLIDVTTGQMRTVKTPCYLLEGVDSSGEYLRFNAQSDPLFWRDVWLKRVDKAAARTEGPEADRSS